MGVPTRNQTMEGQSARGKCEPRRRDTSHGTHHPPVGSPNETRHRSAPRYPTVNSRWYLLGILLRLEDRGRMLVGGCCTTTLTQSRCRRHYCCSRHPVGEGLALRRAAAGLVGPVACKWHNNSLVTSGRFGLSGAQVPIRVSMRAYRGSSPSLSHASGSCWPRPPFRCIQARLRCRGCS